MQHSVYTLANFPRVPERNAVFSKEKNRGRLIVFAVDHAGFPKTSTDLESESKEGAQESSSTSIPFDPILANKAPRNQYLASLCSRKTTAARTDTDHDPPTTLCEGSSSSSPEHCFQFLCSNVHESACTSTHTQLVRRNPSPLAIRRGRDLIVKESTIRIQAVSIRATIGVY